MCPNNYKIFGFYLLLSQFVILVELNRQSELVLKLNDNGTAINVGLTFTKASANQDLQNKFKLCVSSLLRHAKIDINFYIIGDAASQTIAKKIFSEVKNVNINYQIKSLDADDLAMKMHLLVSKMQQHFSHSPSSYYGDSLFFLSIGLFKVFDPEIEKIILLDADLMFKEDIGKLYNLFDEFDEQNLIGIARDGQPVYRHLFWQFRNENPSTRVGNPPPNGLTGFNSGVLLLDLKKMRDSKLYQSLITPKSVEKLTSKYHFKGHLGDQDFFTLVSMEYEQLFYILPCNWNRQLCQWWKKHGYEAVFDQYYKCDGKINIYHGNCNTPIPVGSDQDQTDQHVDLSNLNLASNEAKIDL